MKPSKLIGVILAFILPPAAVLIGGRGIGHLLLNIFLTVFGVWLPGVLHALWCVLKEDEA